MSALLGWVLMLAGGLMAVEKAVGEPMAEAERRVVSISGRASAFSLSISSYALTQAGSMVLTSCSKYLKG